MGLGEGREEGGAVRGGGGERAERWRERGADRRGRGALGSAVRAVGVGRVVACTNCCRLRGTAIPQV